MRERAVGWMQSPSIRRFARFILVGMVNTLFGYAVFAALVLLGLVQELALLIATIVGVAFNFVTTGRFVFDSRDNRRLPRYVAVYAVIYVLNVIALRLLVDAGIPTLYAQPILLPAVVVLTFVAMRLFVFQEPSR